MTKFLLTYIYLTYFGASHPIAFSRIFLQKMKPSRIENNFKTNHEPFVSIIIVTYNALDYIKSCLNSLLKTDYKNKEIIVVDNNSKSEVKKYLRYAKKKGLIDNLYFSAENTFFSGGNNLGAKIASKKAEYLLLLNSDIEIKNPDWLKILINNIPKRGIISFGKVDLPVVRPDGWCFMIDKKTYKQFGGLNEYYKMNWSITELTAKVLQSGFEVKTIANPNNHVYHFGQKSRPKKSSIQFNEMSAKEVINIFGNKQVKLLKI